MSEHGGRVVLAWQPRDEGGHSARMTHVGPERHDEIPLGERCRCGMINFGDWRQRRKIGHWKKGGGC